MTHHPLWKRLLALVSLGCWLLATSIASASVVGPVIPVATSPAIENEPMIAASGSNMVAVWFQDSYNDQVGWASSTDGGETWLRGTSLPRRQSLDYVTGWPMVCADTSGNFYVGVGYGDHSVHGLTLSVYRGSLVGQSINWQGPTYVLPLIYQLPPYDMPRLACDPERGYVYLTYTSGPDVAPFRSSVGFIRSIDSGTTWSTPQYLSSEYSNGSRLVVGPDGEIYIVWEDFSARQMLGRRSLDFGVSFDPPFVVGDTNDDLGMPPPDWYANSARNNAAYPEYYCAGPGFPAVAVDRSNGPHRGSLYVVWPDAATGTTDPVLTTLPENESNNFYANATPFPIGDEITGFELSSDLGGEDDDRFTFQGTAGTTVVITGGVTLGGGFFPENSITYWLECGPDTLQLMSLACGKLFTDRATPPLVYTLPTTDRYFIRMSPALSASASYRLYVQVLHPAPGQAALDHRDVVLTASSDAGARWSPKIRVNDDLPQFDNSLPEVAVDGQGSVHVSWYDRRGAPGCAEQVQTYWTVSTDGAATFQPSQQVSAVASEAAPTADTPGWAVGDHMALQAFGDVVHLLWTQVGQPDADIYQVRIGFDISTGIAVDRFTAEVADGLARLSWEVQDAAGLEGFQVYRANRSAGGFAPAGPKVVANHTGSYEFLDSTVEPAHEYAYRLEVLYRDGTSQWEGPVALDVPKVAARFAWRGVSPNPFGSRLQLTLATPVDGQVRVRVFDVAGHEVTSLSAVASAGSASLDWDGRDRSGHSVPAGVYVLRAGSGAQTALRRIVRVQ